MDDPHLNVKVALECELEEDVQIRDTVDFLQQLRGVTRSLSGKKSAGEEKLELLEGELNQLDDPGASGAAALKVAITKDEEAEEGETQAGRDAASVTNSQLRMDTIDGIREEFANTRTDKGSRSAEMHESGDGWREAVDTSGTLAGLDDVKTGKRNMMGRKKKAQTLDDLDFE